MIEGDLDVDTDTDCVEVIEEDSEEVCDEETVFVTLLEFVLETVCVTDPEVLPEFEGELVVDTE